MTKIHLKLGQQNYFFGIGALEQELAKMGYDVETGLLDGFWNNFAEEAPVCVIVDALSVCDTLCNVHVADLGYPCLIVPIVSAIDWANGLSTVEELKKLGYVVVDLFCDERMHKAEFLPALAFEINAAVRATRGFVFGYVPTGDHPGAFGVRRRHHYHTGVDLYVHRNNAIAYPFLDGEIVDYGHFTGTLCNSPWWNNTHYIAVKHNNRVIVYGEILLSNDFISQDGVVNNKHIGTEVTKRTALGVVVPVTKNRHPEYFYHNNKMLHVELYDASKFRAARVDEWELDKKQPGALLDPTEFLLAMPDQVVPDTGFEEVVTLKGVRLSVKKFTKADVDKLVDLSAGQSNYDIDRLKRLIVAKGLAAYDVGEMLDEMEVGDFENILELIMKVNAEAFPLASNGAVSLTAFLREEANNCVI